MEPTPLEYASPLPSANATRKSMLAWWGAIPVVVFALLQGLNSWQVAHARGRGADFVAGYVCGAVFGGILFCLLIAWISNLISRRSQLVSTIVFTVLMLLLSLSALATMIVRPLRLSGTAPSRSLMGPARVVAAPVRTFPSAGISVDTPAGWQQVPTQKSGIVTQWVGPDSRPGDVRQMIIIQAGRGRGDAIATANALAAKWGGRVVNDHVNLDGETACLIQAEPTKPALQPVEGLVAMHDGNLYLVTGGVTPGHSCEAEFESIRQSWKWIPIASPAERRNP